MFPSFADPSVQNGLSFAFYDEKNFIRLVLFFLARLAVRVKTHHDQLALIAGINRLAEGLVLDRDFLDVPLKPERPMVRPVFRMWHFGCLATNRFNTSVTTSHRCFAAVSGAQRG